MRIDFFFLLPVFNFFSKSTFYLTAFCKTISHDHMPPNFRANFFSAGSLDRIYRAFPITLIIDEVFKIYSASFKKKKLR